MSERLLKEKIVIVTGGSGGIGCAIVNELSKSEFKVVSVYKNNLPAKLPGKNVHLHQANLIISKEWDRLLLFTLEEFGKIDILINCIGFLEPGVFSSLTESQIRQMIETNFTAVLIGINKTLEIMKKQESGHIISIGSLGGIVPMPYAAVYSATKFALRGFTLATALELRKTDIKISLISADSVTTKMLDLEATSQKPSISFYHKPLRPQLIAKKIIKTIRKPKTEIIIPGRERLSAIILGSFPIFFQFLYPSIEKYSAKNQKSYKESRYLKTNISE